MARQLLTPRKLRNAGLGSYFRPIDLQAIGFTEPALRRSVRTGIVEKVARGLYRLTSAESTEHDTVAAVCAKIPRGIVCLLTALQIHGIGTRLSPEVWIAIPRGAQTPRTEISRVRVVRFSGALLTAGVQPIRLDGVPTHITTPARTVVDCFRLSRWIDQETALEALREALRLRRVAPAELLRVAAACGGGTRLRAALDVLTA